MKKPKVAIITNYPSPYRIPLFEKIAKKVDLCVYFTFIGEEEKLWDIKHDYKFKYKILKAYNIKYRSKDILNYHFNPSIFKELLKNDYDIIVVGGYTSLTSKVALLISKIKKTPFIFWSGNTLYEQNIIRKIALPVIKLIIKKSDAFIVYGTRAKDYISSFSVPPEKIFIGLNVGNVDFFVKENEKLKGKREELKVKFDIKSKINILFVGRLIDIKGVEYLINAFLNLKKEKKELGLIIIGDGPLRKRFEKKCQGINDIHFLRFIQPSDLPLIYNISDIFVLPSYYEIFSIALSEAMASALPVISTNSTGGTVDLISNGFNGYIINEKSSYEIYATLKKLVENPDLIKKMGKNSKKMIESELNLDKTAEGFFEAFKYVLKEET